MQNAKDRLPVSLLTSEEVIHELRIDAAQGKENIAAYARRRLKYLRKVRAFPFIRVGHKTYLYPRQGIEKFKLQNLVEAAH